jgi:pyruvate dehydrogenase E1 component alpha subunit
MLRIRRFEERCVELYSAAKIRGFLHLYIGEEAIATGAMAALPDEDAIVATYREHGHALARGHADGPGDGRDVRQGRRGEPRPRRLDAPVRRGHPLLRRQRDRRRRLPIAVGLALADRMQGRTGHRVLLR